MFASIYKKLVIDFSKTMLINTVYEDKDAGTAAHPGSLTFTTSAASQQRVPLKCEIFSVTSGSEKSNRKLG